MYGDMERRGNEFMKFAKNCFVTRAVVLEWPHPTVYVYVVLQPILEKYSVFFFFLNYYKLVHTTQRAHIMLIVGDEE